MSVLVLADFAGGELSEQTARAVTAAACIDPDVHVLVVGDGIGAFCNAAAHIIGVRRVLGVDAACFARASAEVVAAQIVVLAERYATILAADTPLAKAVLPRVAAICDRPMLTAVSAVCDGETFERAIYAGSMIETVRCAGTMVATIRAVSFVPADKVPDTDAGCEIEAVSPVAGPALSVIVDETAAVRAGEVDLGQARIVVSGGRGVAGAEGFALVRRLAACMGAGVGASRAAVDLGFAPNEIQVGQSGRTIAPDLYLAVGISGAIQHVAGIRDAKVIAAINKDPQAPIFRIADFGLVGDLFVALPELETVLKS